MQGRPICTCSITFHPSPFLAQIGRLSLKTGDVISKPTELLSDEAEAPLAC